MGLIFIPFVPVAGFAGFGENLCFAFRPFGYLFGYVCQLLTLAEPYVCAYSCIRGIVFPIAAHSPVGVNIAAIGVYYRAILRGLLCRLEPYSKAVDCFFSI